MRLIFCQILLKIITTFLIATVLTFVSLEAENEIEEFQIPLQSFLGDRLEQY